MIMPFVKRKPREVLVDHRPGSLEGSSVQSISMRDGNKVHLYQDWESQIDKYDYFIIGGSNLIDQGFANSGKILNCHAGLIPATRGLDTFQWDILNGLRLGNTLHIIDEHTDAGEIIYHCETPVFLEDHILTLAERHYQMEIWMLQNFDDLLKRPKVNEYKTNPATRRMNIATEAIMLKAFDEYKAKFAV